MSERWMGVDVGATRTKLVLLEPPDVVCDRRQIDSQCGSAEELAGAVVEALQAWVQPSKGAAATGLGIAVPGLVDRNEGRVLCAPNLKVLNDFAVGAALQEATGLPVALDNDANAAGLAEARMGAAVGCHSAVCLTVGTGVGGAIIDHGRLRRGYSDMAGEFGRVLLDPGSDRPFEEGVGAAAVVKGYCERSGVRPDEIDAAGVARLADAGDIAAQQALAGCGKRLGVGLAILVNLLNPERIVVGGGVAGAGDWFLGPARSEGKRRAWARSWERCEVVKGELGTDAGAIGAALLCGMAG